MIKYIYCLFMAFTAIACSRYPVDVERALKLAGNKRVELEKVLLHYGSNPDDQLKFNAAEYLIANMIGKYSTDNRPVEDYISVFDYWKQMYGNFPETRTEIYDSLVYVHKLQSARQILLDVEHITADYLINNIEHAFKVREQMPWGKTVPFNVFCEEILPYRLGKETLEDWRGKALEHYEVLYDSLRYSSCTDIMEACKIVYRAMGTEWYYFEPNPVLPDMSYSMIEDIRIGFCKELTTLGWFVMRAFGIPVTLDYTPQWPFRSQGHEWNTVHCSDDSYVPFIFMDCPPGMPHKEDHTMAKAYRSTFRIQPEAIVNHEDISNIPSAFRVTNIVDVSRDKFDCIDITISIPEKHALGKSKYAWLSVFNNSNWTPIH